MREREREGESERREESEKKERACVLVVYRVPAGRGQRKRDLGCRGSRGWLIVGVREDRVLCEEEKSSSGYTFHSDARLMQMRALEEVILPLRLTPSKDRLTDNTSQSTVLNEWRRPFPVTFRSLSL